MKGFLWIKCICGYKGFAEMIKQDGWKYYHLCCPVCGKLRGKIKTEE